MRSIYIARKALIVATMLHRACRKGRAACPHAAASSSPISFVPPTQNGAKSGQRRPRGTEALLRRWLTRFVRQSTWLLSAAARA